MADVWYNTGQIAIGIGDLNLGFQAFKIAISVDANHAESWSLRDSGAQEGKHRAGSIELPIRYARENKKPTATATAVHHQI